MLDATTKNTKINFKIKHILVWHCVIIHILNASFSRKILHSGWHTSVTEDGQSRYWVSRSRSLTNYEKYTTNSSAGFTKILVPHQTRLIAYWQYTTMKFHVAIYYLRRQNDVSYQQHKTLHHLQLTSLTYLPNLHPTKTTS